MKKKKVLFICVHNSFRSQMAEAWLNQICGHGFEAQSGGLEPGVVAPLAVEAMHEVGIDMSGKRTRKVFDIWKSGTAFAYVITVCSEAERKGRACPIFPGVTVTLSWPFPDPSRFEGSEAAQREQTRLVRDAIKARSRSGAPKSVHDLSIERPRDQETAALRLCGEFKPQPNGGSVRSNSWR
jgi:arsenate reductase (thioredoxin)